MEEIISLLGSELYNQVLDKLAGKKLLLDDGKLIPKHRFDCINLSLKDHKEQLAVLQELTSRQAEQLRSLKVAECHAEELERKVYILTELSKQKVKNFQTVLPLLHLDGLSGTEFENSLSKQIRALKRSDPYLFSDSVELYRLIPFHGKNKSEV